ncbi:MAG TPA: thermonuclease family protein [Chitinophagaceae bacterium]|nr:thermonuclease family protein [Chitinophagaceae bacterium]
MKKLFVLLFTILPLLVIAQLKGKVVGITDGDTFKLLTADNKQIKVRLYGIDCPEKKQDFGQVAKQFLSDQIFGKQVEVENKNIDRYGRTIGMVFTDNHINVNEALLKVGLAWHYSDYDKNHPAWGSLEKQAREKKIGLWSQPNPIAPWNYRRQKRKSKFIISLSK